MARFLGRVSLAKMVRNWKKQVSLAIAYPIDKKADKA